MEAPPSKAQQRCFPLGQEEEADLAYTRICIPLIISFGHFIWPGGIQVFCTLFYPEA